MNKIYLSGLIILGVLLSVTFLHSAYMSATSYECQMDLPPKPFVDKLTGEEYYIGGDNFNLEIKCEGGILAKFPII